ncbi:hypothetical protein FGO68_gene15036 [Halteria grandinella]|uniref:Uncharacterized protein n=1 Tax=Halteria grandinella TaxID=5974 RepID=A0A8J8NB11_HALGN|nr:hypothetical protein FGO68_gene15036 [Halteria grandinella]
MVHGTERYRLCGGFCVRSHSGRRENRRRCGLVRYRGHDRLWHLASCEGQSDLRPIRNRRQSESIGLSFNSEMRSQRAKRTGVVLHFRRLYNGRQNDSFSTATRRSFDD